MHPPTPTQMSRAMYHGDEERLRRVLSTAYAGGKVRIAAIGGSITYGMGLQDGGAGWVQQLQCRLLGVIFGVSHVAAIGGSITYGMGLQDGSGGAGWVQQLHCLLLGVTSRGSYWEGGQLLSFSASGQGAHTLF